MVESRCCCDYELSMVGEEVGRPSREDLPFGLFSSSFFERLNNSKQYFKNVDEACLGNDLICDLLDAR